MKNADTKKSEWTLIETQTMRKSVINQLISGDEDEDDEETNITDVYEISNESNLNSILNCDKELLEKRIVGRVSCPKCGNVYNELIEELKPMQEGLCNNCHTELVKRADDNSESFKVRYETYLNTTKPLISYYESKGCLYHVDGNSSKHQIFDNIVNILEKN